MENDDEGLSVPRSPPLPSLSIVPVLTGVESSDINSAFSRRKVSLPSWVVESERHDDPISSESDLELLHVRRVIHPRRKLVFDLDENDGTSFGDLVPSDNLSNSVDVLLPA